MTAMTPGRATTVPAANLLTWPRIWALVVAVLAQTFQSGARHPPAAATARGSRDETAFPVSVSSRWPSRTASLRGLPRFSTATTSGASPGHLRQMRGVMQRRVGQVVPPSAKNEVLSSSKQSAAGKDSPATRGSTPWPSGTRTFALGSALLHRAPASLGRSGGTRRARACR